MNRINPWANGPFELLVHAEAHFQKGEDFDRRIALISFDNSIEVSITTYLSLHPIQRGNKQYSKEDVENWTRSYHAKLDFLERELPERGLPWVVDKSHIIWAHDQRNEQYHSGSKGTPEKKVLVLIRKASLWIFCLLFEIQDIEKVLEQAVIENLPPSPPNRNRSYDRVIDKEYGMIEFAGQSYYASEVLFSLDIVAYGEVGSRLCKHAEKDQDEEKRK